MEIIVRYSNCHEERRGVRERSQHNTRQREHSRVGLAQQT